MEFEEIITTISLTFDGGNARKRRNTKPAEGCFYVNFTADVNVEFDETFELQLSTMDPDIALVPNRTTINIINNDCM